MIQELPCFGLLSLLVDGEEDTPIMPTAQRNPEELNAYPAIKSILSDFSCVRLKRLRYNSALHKQPNCLCESA
jgi:hypothetical protein